VAYLSDQVDALRRSRPGPLAPGRDFAALGSALAEVVRRFLREELATQLEAARAPHPSPWMTPPAAARTTGVPVKSIRAWLRSGRITKRLKNLNDEPKQLKYLVNLNEVIEAAEQWNSPAKEVSGEPFAVEERAREILAARAARRR